MEAVTDFVFLGSKIIAGGDCSHEIKRRLLLGRKAMANLDSMLKSRDITLSTKVHLVKAMVFPVIMCGCESWTIKKAECQRIDAFELWCCRRPLFLLPQSLPASGSFQMSQFFTLGGQSIGVSASASLGWTGRNSLQSKGLSRVFSNTQFKSISSSALSSLTSIHDYWKSHSFD